MSQLVCQEFDLFDYLSGVVNLDFSVCYALWVIHKVGDQLRDKTRILEAYNHCVVESNTKHVPKGSPDT